MASVSSEIVPSTAGVMTVYVIPVVKLPTGNVKRKTPTARAMRVLERRRKITSASAAPINVNMMATPALRLA